MNYQLFEPPSHLNNYVSHFWVLEGRDKTSEPRTFTVMSNGCPGLIFLENPDAITGFEGERLPQLFVFGQATKSGRLQFTNTFCNIGVSFRPAALKSIFGLDACELTHQNTSISNLVKTSLNEQLANCNTPQQKVTCLTEFLQQQADLHAAPDNRIEYALTQLRHCKTLPDIRRNLNISERSLERLFLAHIGITPVMYSRIMRFQAAITQIRRGNRRSLTDIAHSLDYFDQSHFIRDFKLFSGVTPGAYLRKAIEHMPGFPEWEA